MKKIKEILTKYYEDYLCDFGKPLPISVQMVILTVTLAIVLILSVLFYIVLCGVIQTLMMFPYHTFTVVAFFVVMAFGLHRLNKKMKPWL